MLGSSVAEIALLLTYAETLADASCRASALEIDSSSEGYDIRIAHLLCIHLTEVVMARIYAELLMK